MDCVGCWWGKLINWYKMPTGPLLILVIVGVPITMPMTMTMIMSMTMTITIMMTMQWWRWMWIYLLEVKLGAAPSLACQEAWEHLLSRTPTSSWETFNNLLRSTIYLPISSYRTKVFHEISKADSIVWTDHRNGLTDPPKVEISHFSSLAVLSWSVLNTI